MLSAYPDDNIARALAALLGEVQVLQSRAHSLTKGEASVRSWSIAMKDNVVMAASVVARCEDMFDFARVGSDFAEPTKRHLESVLTIAGIREPYFPRVWQSLVRFENDDPAETIMPPRHSLLARIAHLRGRKSGL